MSYYTYFYPKKDLYNEKGLSVEELNREIAKRQDSIASTKILLKEEAVTAYYADNTKEAMNRLTYLWRSLVCDYEILNKYEWALHIKDEIKEYNSVAINHANCESEYQLEETIANSKEYINNLLSQLIILTRIKFSKGKKEMIIGEIPIMIQK